MPIQSSIVAQKTSTVSIGAGLAANITAIAYQVATSHAGGRRQAANKLVHAPKAMLITAT